MSARHTLRARQQYHCHRAGGRREIHGQPRGTGRHPGRERPDLARCALDQQPGRGVHACLGRSHGRLRRTFDREPYAAHTRFTVPSTIADSGSTRDVHLEWARFRFQKNLLGYWPDWTEEGGNGLFVNFPIVTRR